MKYLLLAVLAAAIAAALGFLTPLFRDDWMMVAVVSAIAAVVIAWFGLPALLLSVAAFVVVGADLLFQQFALPNLVSSVVWGVALGAVAVLAVQMFRPARSSPA